MVEAAAHGEPPVQRLRLTVRGLVQGVGFRPFVYRLAQELNLAGWVKNGPQGVVIEAEGRAEALRQLVLRIEPERPPHCVIQSLEPAWLDAVGYRAFEIVASDSGGTGVPLVLPDIAICAECRREIFDSSNRRYRYPFTNCTHCGPRFSIIESLPYDRPNTSMRRFVMCSECAREYRDPADRRFHAQPNACAACGPRVAWWNATGESLAEGDDALRHAVRRLREGGIVAVKGLGGFHLMVRADDAGAVERLRQRKQREEKPFALMAPSLADVRLWCRVDDQEARLLQAPEAPIVLLRRHAESHPRIAAGVAPGNPCLGVMLPYTPLHLLLLTDLGLPLVATSGNLSDEPICTDETEAVERLAGIADAFLVHNRPIVRHMDDSIARVALGRELVLRRARGYAPLPVPCRESSRAVLGVGAHLKNTVALRTGPNVFLSQHIGDLEGAAARAAFASVASDLQTLFRTDVRTVMADVHPDYLSSRYAEDAGQPVLRVQHHYAHALACLAENELEPPVLAVAWDGTGYGLDQSIWGGEFFLIRSKAAVRVGHWRTFCLPGGERAIREPRRCAAGLLWEAFGEPAFGWTELPSMAAFPARDLAALAAMMVRRVNCPVTSSVGRLFDAISSLLGLRQQLRHEGQAAMLLEYAAEQWAEPVEPYDAPLVTEPPAWPRTGSGAVDVPSDAFSVDWKHMLEQIIAEIRLQGDPRRIAARFHLTLAETIVQAARRTGERRVLLTGGCFQNKLLTELTVARLRQAGLAAYWHQRVPPNDGGIALGQVMAMDAPPLLFSARGKA